MRARLAARLSRWWRRPDPPAVPAPPIVYTPREFQRAVATLAGRPAGLTDRDLDVLRAAGQGLGTIAREARDAARRRTREDR